MRPAGGRPLSADPAAPPSSAAGGPAAGTRGSLSRLLRDAARLDRTQSDPVVSGRNALGIVAPLIIGILAGSITLGLAATIGALQTSFADRPGPYRLRMLRMLGTALAAAVTTALAVVFSRSDAASVVLLLVLAFVAGLLLTAGPSATQVGIAGVAAALILGHIPQPPSVAVHVGLLVLAGGAGQALLAIAAWPLRRHRPERVALAGLYREIATAARVPAGTRAGPPASDTLTSVRQTLFGLGHDHGPSVEAYRVLFDEAARIRREIVTVIGAAERLAGDRNPILAGLVRSSLTATGRVLDEIAAALAAARPVREEVLDRARAELRHTIGRLEDSEHAPGELTRRAVAARLRALSGQLRAAVESTRTGAAEGGGQGLLPDPYGVAQLVRNPIEIVRANLTPDSAVLRHAVRVAVLVAGSDLVVRLLGFDRGYWVALTVLVVLRPDFGATLQRAVMRTLGTVVGLLLASELVHWIPGGPWYQVALIALGAFGMRLAGPGNVALSAVSLSGLVVVLLAIDGIAPHTTLVSRSVATLAGGALAVLAALVLLPTWERTLVPMRLAALLGAYRAYVAAIAEPSTGRDELGRARAAARLARTNAQASVDRARAEPVRAQAEIELGEAVLAHTHRLAHAALTLDAVRGEVHQGGGLPELTAFTAGAEAALASAEAAARSASAPRAVPRLRALEQELADAVTADATALGGIETATTIVDAADRMTNSIDTVLDVMHEHYGRDLPSDDAR